MPITFTTADRTVTFTVGIERSQPREIYWYLEGVGVQADQFDTSIEGTLTLNQQTTIYVTVKENASLENFVLKVKDGDAQGGVVLTSDSVSIKHPARFEIVTSLAGEEPNTVLVTPGQNINYHIQGYDITDTIQGKASIEGVGVTSAMFLPPNGVGPVFFNFTNQNNTATYSAILADYEDLVDGTKFKLVLRDNNSNEILAESRELIMVLGGG